MKTINPMKWHYTPFCLFTNHAVFHTDDGIKMVNRFMRPAYWRVLPNRQTRIPVLQLLSPSEYRRQWIDAVTDGLQDIPVSILREIFVGWSLSLARYEKLDQSVAAAALAHVLWKARDSKSDSVLDVLISCTDASTSLDLNNMTPDRHVISQFLISSLTMLPVEDKAVMSLSRQIMGGQIESWEDLRNIIRAMTAND